MDIKTITGWTKDLSLLREKEFNHENLKAFKSLKAYKYFADGFVMNVSG